MAKFDTEVTITVKQPTRPDGAREASITLKIPSNDIYGIAIAPEGKEQIGTWVEQIGTVVDKHNSAL